MAGVEPATGVTLIQLTFELTVRVATPTMLSTWTVCETGVAPPSVCKNDKEAGDAVIVGVGAGATVSVTGTEMVVAPAVTVTEP